MHRMCFGTWQNTATSVCSEAACARNWHGRDVLYDPISGRGRGDMYCDILQGAADGGNALEVFKWLAKSKDTYFFVLTSGLEFQRTRPTPSGCRTSFQAF